MNSIKKHLLALPLLVAPLIAYNQTATRTYDPVENQIQWPAQFDPATSDFYVHNVIDIEASPEEVWALLIDALYWITWYDGIENIVFEPPAVRYLAKDTRVFWSSMGQDLHNTVVECITNQRLAWQFNEAKIQGHHAWLIVPTANGCRVITDESQTGKLAKLQKIFLPRKLLKQHNRWLMLLKEQAERR